MHTSVKLETEKGETTNARRMNGAVLLQMLLLLLLAARAQQQQVTQARTDPKEVAALDAILGRWGRKTSPLWKMSNEPCYGRRRRQHRPRRQPQEQPRHQVRLQRHRLPYYQAESVCTKCCWEDSSGTTKSNLPDILVRVISSSTKVKKDTDINT